MASPFSSILAVDFRMKPSSDQGVPPWLWNLHIKPDIHIEVPVLDGDNVQYIIKMWVIIDHTFWTGL